MGMKAPVTGGGGEYEQAPKGNYLAVCNGIYMIGTQAGFQGQPARSQLIINFELHKRKGPALGANGRIFETSNIITNSFNEKSNLLAYAEALLGVTYTEDDLKRIKGEGGFDPETLLGKSCRLTLGRKDSGKDKILSLAPLDAEDDTPPEPQTDQVYWDWTLGVECPKRAAYFWGKAQENPDGDFKASAARELVGAGVPRSAADDDMGDVPF